MNQLMPIQVPLVIIGAGPAGLGAAWHWTRQSNEPCLVLEASDRPGGLSASWTDDAGFTWDQGSHLLFSHYNDFDEVMNAALPPSDWLHRERLTFVWFDGRFIPYPFQLNLHHLPVDERWKCVRDLLDRPERQAHDNFAVWCKAAFGNSITELFMRPYNEKLWMCRLEEMNAKWIAERVAVPELATVLKNLCYSSDDTRWGPNAEFRYPRVGGAGRVWRAVADRLPDNSIRYLHRVIAIDRNRKRLTTSDGRTIAYQYLMSTVPLPSLSSMLRRPDELADVDRLRYTSTHIVGVGIAGQPSPELHNQCWSYFPQASIPFYRMTVLSNLSDGMVPEPGRTWSLMTEVAEKKSGPPAPPDEVVASVVDALVDLKIVSREDIISISHRYLPFGYPVPMLDRDQILHDVQDFLEEHQIYSRGRFGAWLYEVSNQDHSFMQGVELVDRLLHGTKETTLNSCRQPTNGSTYERFSSERPVEKA